MVTARTTPSSEKKLISSNRRKLTKVSAKVDIKSDYETPVPLQQRAYRKKDDRKVPIKYIVTECSGSNIFEKIDPNRRIYSVSQK